MAIFDKIGEFAKSTTEKAGDKIEITRINGKIKTEQQAIQGLKAELGARYWDKISAGEIEADPSVADIVEKINASLAGIAELEAEIRKIEEERAAAEAAAREAAEAKAAAEAAAKAAPPVVAPAVPQYDAQPQAYAPQAPAFEPQQPASGLEGSAPVQGEYHFGAPAQPAPASAPPQFTPAPPAASAPPQFTPAQPAAPAPPQFAAAPPAAGPKCAACGTQLILGAKFCPECGTPAPASAPARRFCPNCGTGLKPEARFCPECGTKA